MINLVKGFKIDGKIITSGTVESSSASPRKDVSTWKLRFGDGYIG